MKTTILILAALCMIFVACENSVTPVQPQTEELSLAMAPGLNQGALAKGNMKTLFEGRCDWILDIDGGKTIILPNGKTQIKGQTSQWYDDANDLMVTGDSFWDVNWLIEEDGNAKIWGKAEIDVDDDGGTWGLSWHGWRTPTGEGPFIEWVSPFPVVPF